MILQNNLSYPINTAPRNFDFVPFPSIVNNRYITDIKKRRGNYSGVIQLEMKAVDDIYCGNGNVDFDANVGLTSQTLVEDNKCIIPGSSIKGALRHVTRAISDGCIIPSEAPRDIKILKEQEYKCSLADGKKFFEDRVCIVCDMFGMMGLSSKIVISDFEADKFELVKCDVPDQFTPNIQSPNYKYEDDGPHIGYKFYKTNCDDRSMLSHNNVIYAVKKGTVFKGEVRFRYLDEKELALLMFSLGIARDFSHKIGGYRADGFGTMNFTCVGFTLNGTEKTTDDALNYADTYYDNICSEETKDRIEALRDIMEYKE